MNCKGIGVINLTKSNANYLNSKRYSWRIKPVQCSIKARWCIDVKFGMKGQAIDSLSQWVQTIGKDAGLTPNSVTILSGAVGVAESKIELEICFESIYQLEEFWGKINPDQHKIWSKNAMSFVVDGSPRWDIYRQTNPFQSQSNDFDSSSPKTKDSKVEQLVEIGDSGLVMPVNLDIEDLDSTVQGLNPQILQQKQQSASERVDQMVDWKGDPMKINPGDKLPFNFQ